jgi:hypothetical protein
MIKTINYSDHKISPRLTRFYSVFFSVILVLGLFNGFLVKNALASNNYLNNVLFYIGSDGQARVSFNVQTSFSFTTNYYYYETFAGVGGDDWLNKYGFSVIGVVFIPEDRILQDNTLYSFSAGSHYVCKLSYMFGGIFYPLYKSGNLSSGGVHVSLDSNSYIQFNSVYLNLSNDKYYFTEFPSLTITYPHDQDQIAGAFNIQGSYTIPASSTYDTLIANFGYETSEGLINTYRFSQALATSSGSVNIRVSGLSAGEYHLYFYFSHDSDIVSAYNPSFFAVLYIVNDIPPELPTGETPPQVPIFNSLDPITYYNQHSSDTPSDLYLNLTSTFSPLITNLGTNLVQFANQFTGSQASAIASSTANSIITIKSYANNLNSFFNGLPVIQLLTGYILVFLAITIFRIAKGIIGLFKI